MKELKPMLLHTIQKVQNKLEYPALVQPKLDGCRCLAQVKDGKATLFSRNMKDITSGLPHVVEELEQKFDFDIILDCELYKHGQSLNWINKHAIRPTPSGEKVELHVFDIVDSEEFGIRSSFIDGLFASIKFEYIKQVDTFLIESESEMWEKYEDFKNDNYEGLIYRKREGQYEFDRSYDVLKLKINEKQMNSIGKVTKNGEEVLDVFRNGKCRIKTDDKEKVVDWNNLEF